VSDPWDIKCMTCNVVMEMGVHRQHASLKILCQHAKKVGPDGWRGLQALAGFGSAVVDVHFGYPDTDSGCPLDLGWLATHCEHDLRPSLHGRHDTACWKPLHCKECGRGRDCSLDNGHPGDCIPE
jgi:hypothetical protein